MKLLSCGLQIKIIGGKRLKKTFKLPNWSTDIRIDNFKDVFQKRKEIMEFSNSNNDIPIIRMNLVLHRNNL